MGTVAILAGAAFSCCVAIQLYSLPATGLLSSAQTVQEPPDSCPITKPPQLPFIPPRAALPVRRSCLDRLAEIMDKYT
jgi:hypothetical protein